MLILTRKRDQAIVIGDDIIVRVTRVRGNQVEIGIDAPTHIPVHRQEIYDQVVKQNQSAAAKSTQLLAKIKDLPKAQLDT